MNVRDDLKAYVDGELPQARAEQVRQALEADPDLRAEADFYRALGSSIRAHAAEVQVVGADRAMERATRPGLLSRLGRRGLVASGLTAVLALIALGVVLDPSRSHQEAVSMDRAMDKEAEQSAVASSPAPAYSEQAPASSERAPGRGGAGSMQEERFRAKSLDAGARDEMEPSRLIVPDDAMIIRTAALRLEAPDVPAAHRRATQVASSVGGYVEASQIYQSARAESSLTLRVPVRKLEEALERLRELGRVSFETSDSEDVTGQHADIGARLKALRAEEQGYVEMLSSSRRVSDSLEIRSRLGNVRQTIESLESQQAALKDRAAMSKIELTLTTPPPAQPKPVSQAWNEEAWNSAVAGVSSAGRSIARALIFVFVYLPIWAPVFVGFAWAWRRWGPLL
jgi:hypothetical protein